MNTLSTDWEVQVSRSTGKKFYWNIKTNETQWDPPENQNELEVPTNKKVSKVKCSHIIIKHNESRNPRSWKSSKITQSKHQALEKLKNLRMKIILDELNFEEAAYEHSDCSSHDQGGDLGYIYPNQLQQEFEDAAFELRIGEISHPVWTASGVHIILRTD